MLSSGKNTGRVKRVKKINDVKNYYKKIDEIRGAYNLCRWGDECTEQEREGRAACGAVGWSCDAVPCDPCLYSLSLRINAQLNDTCEGATVVNACSSLCPGRHSKSLRTHRVRCRARCQCPGRRAGDRTSRPTQASKRTLLGGRRANATSLAHELEEAKQTMF